MAEHRHTGIGTYSRRDVLLGALTAGIAATSAHRVAALQAQAVTAVSFRVPAGACDCHTHAFGDPQQFPMAPERVYTPGRATVPQMQALHRALHTERVVLVQPSVYGTDNRCTLDAIKQNGSGARGVAVIDATTSDSNLADLARQGIRGIRINLEQGGVTDMAVARQRLQAAIDRVKALNWHVEIYARLEFIAGVTEQILASPVPIVIDHFARAAATDGVQQPGFDLVLRAVRAGHAYVKLSAPYLNSTLAPDYGDMAPLAKALIGANPDRMLWGSDWPHPDARIVAGRKATDPAPAYQVDDGRLLSQLAAWAPDEVTRKKILVDNPARLYGF
ncbi:MAG: amidohydrolase family protein [Vicinamibacterales bacterium]